MKAIRFGLGVALGLALNSTADNLSAAALTTTALNDDSTAVEADWLARDGGITPAGVRATIRRGRALAARLGSPANRTDLADWNARFDALEQRLSTATAAARLTAAGLCELWREAHRLGRRIAFGNPRLRGIRRLLFISHHDAKGVFHMVDRLYGFNARPGCRLLVLEDPFGPAPRRVDLLRPAVVQNGRLKGRRLDGGGVLKAVNHGDSTRHLVAYDGSGNVAGLLGANDGAVSARYEYGPFGERLRGSKEGM